MFAKSLGATCNMENLNLFIINSNMSLGIIIERSCCQNAVTLWAATIMALYNNKTLSQDQPCGPHLRSSKVPKIIFAIDQPCHFVQFTREERITKLGGVKIAQSLRDALFGLSMHKGGVRGAKAGNHPEGLGWVGGDTLGNKVQVTS